jgi:integrase
LWDSHGFCSTPDVASFVLFSATKTITVLAGSMRLAFSLPSCLRRRGSKQLEAVPGWFDLAARTVEIRATETFRPKDRDARTVPLTDQFVDFLKRWGLRSPYVLQPDVTHGSHRYRFDFRRAFGEYMKVQGVPWISPHVMRHSFASICASKGIDIYRIATWFGTDVRVVQRHYAKLRPDDRQIMKAFTV